MLGSQNRTKNTCSRTGKKASNISMIQVLYFEMLSSMKQCNMLADTWRMKPLFVHLYAKLTHLNKKRNI